MHTDRDFLVTIDTRPGDRAFRLIYADWLDERSDPRGELIRIEEEMRQLPVYSDPFWALKPRRNELRNQIDADWLARMKYGTECEPVFRHGIPDGWRERWRLIREFTERWFQLPMPDVGGRRIEVREAESHLGRVLPPSVCEWVAYAYDVLPPDGSLVVHRDSYTMEKVPGHPALSLLLQAEGDHHWAVQYDDLHLVDPPVHGYHWVSGRNDDMDFTLSERNPEAGSVTEFALGYAMTYMTEAKGGFGMYVLDTDQLIRDLMASFPVHTQSGAIAIFVSDNILVQLHHEPIRFYLQVELFKPMQHEAMPAVLREYTRKGR